MLVNIWPMLVYSLVGIVLAIVATIPFGLGWLVLAPVFAASVYASYKDIFGASALRRARAVSNPAQPF